MLSYVRWIMAVEAISLLVAAALHAGIVISGPLDQAAYYESGIAVILTIGLALTFLRPGPARWSALATQAVALAGACIGLYLALRGLGPNTVPDIVYHFALVALLVIGLIAAWRMPPGAAFSRDG
jgi:hypothetical protein